MTTTTQTTERERRAGIPAEVRAEDGNTVRVSGYAAVYGQEADIGGYFTEVIAPGAFDAALERGDDVVFLINHDGLPLARTRSGTLRLSADSRGLRVETDLDARDPDVQSILYKMERGDLDKMSFAFRATRQRWDETQDPPQRTIEEVELYDVAIVTTPAYDQTEIGLRSLKAHRAEKARTNFHAARLRMRMKTDLAARRGARSETG